MTSTQLPPQRIKVPKTKAALAGVILAVTPISTFEGLQRTAYLDPVSIPTVCYGETRGVKLGMKFTVEECQSMLQGRLMEFAAGIEKCVYASITPEVWAASISLAYNIGEGAFCKSSVVRLLNSGQTRAACEAFMKWNKAGGLVFRGLTKRRSAERELCLKGA